LISVQKYCYEDIVVKAVGDSLSGKQLVTLMTGMVTVANSSAILAAHAGTII
jgi:hypothetical protein